MKKLIFPAIIGLISFASCQNGGGSNSAQYAGVWQAVGFETPTEDSMTDVQIDMQLKQIAAWTEVPKELMEQIKTKNLDSAKAFATDFINEQKSQMEPQRKQFIDSFKLDLQADGNAYRIIGSIIDTAYWYTATTKSGTNLIILDPFVSGKQDIPMQATLSGFQVVYASSDSLRLAVHQPEDFKTFISLKKAK